MNVSNDIENSVQSSQNTHPTEPAQRDIFMDLSFEKDDCDNIRIDPVLPPSVNINIVIENPKKERNKFKWVEHSKFASLEEALEFLEGEGFVCYDDKELKIGQKFYFRCKKAPMSLKTMCALRYTLFLPSDTNDIILYHTGNEHNHVQLMQGKNQLMSGEMISFVESLFAKDVIKYERIIEFIDEERAKQNVFEDEPNPRKRQIEYRLSEYRNSKIKPIIKLGDLNKWCNDNAIFPANKDTAFVLSNESTAVGDDMRFRFSLSTPALLEKCIGLKTICIDATYKLNWNGFPLIVLGTVDRQKRFHPLLYACASHETTEDYSFVFESLKNAIEVFYEEKF